MRERAKDGAALEHLAGQIRTTSGSIKLIEEQLNVREPAYPPCHVPSPHPS